MDFQLPVSVRLGFVHLLAGVAATAIGAAQVPTTSAPLLEGIRRLEKGDHSFGGKGTYLNGQRALLESLE